MILDSKFVRAAHSFHPSHCNVRDRVWVDGVLWDDSPIVEAESHGCADVTIRGNFANPNHDHRGFVVSVSGADDYGFVRRFGIPEIEAAMHLFHSIPSPVSEEWLVKNGFELW